MSNNDINLYYHTFTSEDSHATLEGTSSQDLLRFSGDHSTVNAYGGDDAIYILGKHALADAGEGDDAVCVFADDATVKTGVGDDFIWVNNYMGAYMLSDPSLVSNSSSLVTRLTLSDLTSSDTLMLQQEGTTGKKRTFSLSEQNNGYVLTDSENNLTLILTNTENVADLVNVPVFDYYSEGDLSDYNYEYYYTTLGEMLSIPNGGVTPPVTSDSKYSYYGSGNISINYESGTAITWNCSFTGIGLSGNDFYMYSGQSSLCIQESKDKLIEIEDSGGQIAGRVYWSSVEGTLDGSLFNDGVEVIVGGDNVSNLIYGGGTSSSLWGGVGGVNDSLIGGTGADTFFYGYGEGNDVIGSTNELDNINLYNITLANIADVRVYDRQVLIKMNDGATLSVFGSANEFALGDGTSWKLINRSTSAGTWIREK